MFKKFWSSKKNYITFQKNSGALEEYRKNSRKTLELDRNFKKNSGIILEPGKNFRNILEEFWSLKEILKKFQNNFGT